MLLQQLINGLTLGAIYTLVALSYSLVMGILGILNLAISDLFMLGGYFGFVALIQGYSLIPAIVVAMVGAAILALVVERVAYYPLRDAPAIVPLLSTLGFSIIFQNIAINVWGSDPLQLPGGSIGDQYFAIAGTNASIGEVQVAIIAIAVLFVVILATIVQSTWLGYALRAIAENREVARVLGVSVARITTATFLLSGLLAGSAGTLIGLHYAALTPSMGVDVGLKAVAVMVIGGTTQIWGVLVAGPLVGIVEVLTIAYGGSSYRDIVVYGLMILVLLLRPQGILGSAAALRTQRV